MCLLTVKAQFNHYFLPSLDNTISQTKESQIPIKSILLFTVFSLITDGFILNRTPLQTKVYLGCHQEPCFHLLRSFLLFVVTNITRSSNPKNYFFLSVFDNLLSETFLPLNPHTVVLELVRIFISLNMNRVVQTVLEPYSIICEQSQKSRCTQNAD